jgi:hypothetical protein
MPTNTPRESPHDGGDDDYDSGDGRSRQIALFDRMRSNLVAAAGVGPPVRTTTPLSQVPPALPSSSAQLPPPRPVGGRRISSSSSSGAPVSAAVSLLRPDSFAPLLRGLTELLEYNDIVKVSQDETSAMK